MKKAIILHGKPDKEVYEDSNYPSASNFHWLPWMQKQLQMRDIHAQTPEIPYSWNPQYDIWKHTFELFSIDEKTLLIGHSCGGGFLLRWMSEQPNRHFGKVILVAPWLDMENTLDTGFFDFELDNKVASRCDELIVFHSKDDMPEIQSTFQEIISKLEGVKSITLDNYGHFTKANLKNGREFPELLEESIQ